VRDRGDDGFARGCREGAVARAVEEGEDGAEAGGVDEVDGERFGDAEAAGERDAVDARGEVGHAVAGRGELERGVGHERVDGGVREAEVDVLVPADAEIVDGVAGGARGGLRVQVGRDAVRDDGVEEAALVAEQAVDRGSLHAGRSGDGARRERFAALAREELARGGNDPGSWFH
jgi:hypothetical protein